MSSRKAPLPALMSARVAWYSTMTAVVHMARINGHNLAILLASMAAAPKAEASRYHKAMAMLTIRRRAMVMIFVTKSVTQQSKHAIPIFITAWMIPAHKPIPGH